VKTLCTLLLAVVAASTVAQGQRAARLPWGNLDVVLFPDSAAGTLVWVASRAASPADFGKDREFLVFVNPESALAWIPRARAFLAQKMTDTDTARVALSNDLEAIANGVISLGRHRVKGRWSDDCLIALSGLPARPPVFVSATDALTRAFLDSFTAVALRTPEPSPSQTRMLVANQLDRARSVVPSSTNQTPYYPGAERRARVEGDVWLSFVVTPEGQADMKTVRVLLSDDVGFLQSVRDALATHRFRPATQGGVPVAARVYQRFVFRLTFQP
jgi:TonB family protein